MDRRTAWALMVLCAACSKEPRRHSGDDDERPGVVASGAEAAVEASASAVAVESTAVAESSASSTSSAQRYGVRGPSDSPDPHIARSAALRDAQEFGMVGLGATPSASGSARGNMWGDEIGDAFGAGGLGLSGIGEGGLRGRGEGIGLGSIGTIGHGAGPGSGHGVGGGSGRLGGARATKPPSVRMGATSVTGALPPEVIQRIVRQNFGRFRLCYENGLDKDPTLAGRVVVAFTIRPDGSVAEVKGSGDMPDAKVVDCVTKAFWGLSFPQPEKGSVKVSYPIAFAPGDAPPKPEAPAVARPTVNGKLLVDVTTTDIEAALRAAGCTDVSSKTKEGSRVVVFTVTKDKRTFTVSFVPASAGVSALSPEELADIEKRGAVVRRDGAFFIAVESDDKGASRTLLDSIVKNP